MGGSSELGVEGRGKWYEDGRGRWWEGVVSWYEKRE